MDTRHSQLVLISKRIEKANDKINQIIENLGWTRAQLKQWQNEQAKVMTCPFDKRHQVPSSSMKEHYRRCLYKSRGAKMVKKTRPPSSLFFYKEAPSVVSFVDAQTKVPEPHKNLIEIIPAPQNYYVEELEPIPTIAEKCQAYDQVIQRSHQLKKANQHDTLSVCNEIDRRVFEKQKQQKKKAHEDQQQLDKRRRKQYRVKMKMITPTEIQRELIHAYMQEYKDWKQ